MADSEEQRAPRYSAFISYSHHDVNFARHLHRQLENYRLPRRLFRNSKARARGRDARRLKPLFRDRDELTAAADLTDAVRTAIATSAHLIVICSPNSAKSEWVGREVELFRGLHGDQAILAALYEGTSATAFHKALLLTGADHKPLKPLAADFRRNGDGSRLALLKLVAVLADVGLDELVQRDAQRRIRRIAAVTIAAVVGMLVTGLLAVLALQARAAAERERERGEAMVGYLLDDLRDRLKGAGRLDLLEAVNQGAVRYYRGQNLAKLSTGALQQRARLLQAIGEDDEKRDDVRAALSQFTEAKRTTAELLEARPADPARIFAHAQSEYWVGFAHWRLGNDREAGAAFGAYTLLAKRLVRLAPDNPDWLLEAGYADSNLGMFLLRRSIDTARAGALFEAALGYFKAAAGRRPADDDIQVQIADGHAWLADVERLRGNHAGALAHRMTQRRILEVLLARDPRNAETQAYLVGNSLALARIAAAQGAPARALSGLRRGHESALALARTDPENADAAKQVRIFELFEVRTWLAMPRRQRPSAETIAARLGNCAAERARPHNDELATFCTILQARLMAENGDRPGAARLVASLKLKEGAHREMLTERWHIDLRNELGSIR